jgi:TonB family protein
MQTSEPSLIARHAVIFAILALMGANAGARNSAQKSADPGATELYVIPGAGKNRLPVGDCPAPSWPREAQRYEIEGVTRIRYKLLPDGRVGEPRVIKSSGWAILDDATIALALSWRYTPRAVRIEGNEVDPALADEVIGYLGNCRFAYDPQARGVRTDTMYGRVLLR